MTARKKAAPIALTWLRSLAHAERPPAKPSATAVLAVGTVLVAHADPNGANCYPSMVTIAELAGVDKHTVISAVRWFRDHGWLELVGKQRYGQHVYRLVMPFPGGAPSHTTTDGVAVRRDTLPGRSGGAPSGTARSGSGVSSGVPCGAPSHTQPPTSDRKGGEVGGAEGPSASAAPTAPPPPATQHHREFTATIEAITGLELDVDNIDLRSHADRLAAWSPDDLAALFTGRDPTTISKPNGYVLSRLRQGVPNPADDPRVVKARSSATSAPPVSIAPGPAPRQGHSREQLYKLIAALEEEIDEHYPEELLDSDTFEQWIVTKHLKRRLNELGYWVDGEHHPDGTGIELALNEDLTVEQLQEVLESVLQASNWASGADYRPWWAHDDHRRQKILARLTGARRRIDTIVEQPDVDPRTYEAVGDAAEKQLGAQGWQTVDDADELPLDALRECARIYEAWATFEEDPTKLPPWAPPTLRAAS